MPTLTVSTPAAVRGLVPLAVVKDELGISDAASDARLNRWIAEESGRICQHCGVAADQVGRRTFAVEALVVTFDACGGRSAAPLILPWRIPVTDVSEVRTGGVVLGTEEYEAEPMAALLYRLDAAGNRVAWPAARTVVVLTAGWDLAAEEHPEPLRRACLELVRARWQAGNRDPNLKRDRVDGVGEQEFWVSPTSPDADGLPSDIAALVAPYTNIRVA